MRRDPHAREVRAMVVRTFIEFGAGMATLAELSENILVDDGRYMARSYRAGGLMAMWLVEVGLLQFYGADGEMLRTVNLFQTLEPQRVAA